jgi:hypothetical protein
VICQCFLASPQNGIAEAKVIAERHRTFGTTEIKDRFIPCGFDVYVCRAMVIQINPNVQAVDPEHSWHRRRIAYS